MKFSCISENLAEVLSIAERFIGKNLILPILSNVLVVASQSSIVIKATNLECAVELTLPGKVIKEGSASVPVKILHALMQSVREENVDIEEKQNNVFVKSESVTTRINGMNPDDFPLIPKIKRTNSFTADSAELKQGLAFVLSAVSLSEFKPELTGIFFKAAPSSLKMAATDTFRLTEKTISISNQGKDSFSFILPSKAAFEAARVLRDGGEVEISIGENQAILEQKGLTILTRTIEGMFPEYAAIIPAKFETSCFLKKNELMQMVRSSSIFSSKVQEVEFRFENNTLEISSGNSEIGEYRTKVPVPFTGNNLSVSFNYRYLLDGLSALEEEEIFLGLNNETLPTLLRNKSEMSSVYVLMPIRKS